MNCECGRVVFPNQGHCVCGRATGAPDLKSATQTALGEHRAIVNAYITQYRQKHPGATKREACLSYLKSKGLYTMLPKHLQEAGAERDAVSEEI